MNINWIGTGFSNTCRRQGYQGNFVWSCHLSSVYTLWFSDIWDICGSQSSWDRTHKKPWIQSQHDQGTQRSCIQKQAWWGMRLDCEWKARLGYLVIYLLLNIKKQNLTLMIHPCSVKGLTRIGESHIYSKFW